ncbi:alpha/beta hydrolase family esterase [Parafrankia elaeagni]|uniref:alpha/beta hydrolase family esterase n=1 Tax=Parafrankia elaeagni TaxID=222534 RepID=UPI000372AE90|nr:PHB depolymerase family esterase [Parafrankia elaeagni]
MAIGTPAGRRRSHGRAGAGAGRSASAGRSAAASGRLAGLSALRHGARPANTLWLPITAAVGVLLLLLWYAMSQSPAGDAESAAPVASALGEAGGPGAAAPSAMPTVPPPPSNGCDTGRSLPAGVTTETVPVSGADRQYVLAVPQGGGAGSPLPLVLNLHDQAQSAPELEQYTQMTDSGTRAGYAVVSPVGAASRWNFTRSAEVGPDDVLFVGTMLNDLTVRMCLDPQRVFLSGFSDGADMALGLACALPDRFAAVVTVASSRLPDDCPAPRASLLELHGTEDPVAPWDGGGPPRAAPYAGLVAQPVVSRADRYARSLGCGGEHQESRDFTNVIRTAWTSCPQGRDVGVLAMQGGGHTWPGAADRPELGRTVPNLSATVVAMAFFAGHPADGRTVTGGSGTGGGNGSGGGGSTGGASGGSGAAPQPTGAGPAQPPAAPGTPGAPPAPSAPPGGTSEPTPGTSASPTPVVPATTPAPPAGTTTPGQGADGDT